MKFVVYCVVFIWASNVRNLFWFLIDSRVFLVPVYTIHFGLSWLQLILLLLLSHFIILHLNSVILYKFQPCDMWVIASECKMQQDFKKIIWFNSLDKEICLVKSCFTAVVSFVFFLFKVKLYIWIRKWSSHVFKHWLASCFKVFVKLQYWAIMNWRIKRGRSRRSSSQRRKCFWSPPHTKNQNNTNPCTDSAANFIHIRNEKIVNDKWETLKKKTKT